MEAVEAMGVMAVAEAVEVVVPAGSHATVSIFRLRAPGTLWSSAGGRVVALGLGSSI